MTLALLALLASFPAAAAASYPAVRSDPRFDLLGTVQLLASAEKRYSGFHRHDTPYTRATEAWFKPFASHPVVEVYERIAARGLDYLFFQDFLFSLGDPPGLEPRRRFEPGTLAAAGGPAELEQFRLLLSDFARVSRFEDFFRETAPLRAEMHREVSAQAVELGIKPRLERYTGLPVKQRYVVIVSPFAEPSLSSTWAEGTPGARSLTSLYGPEDLDRQAAKRGAPRGGAKDLRRVGFRLHTRLGGLLTEILMDQLDAAARPHRARLVKSKSLFAPLEGSCAPDWYGCVQRHVAFAVAARILDLSGEHEAAAEWPVKYGRIGLPYIGPLAERLREFESGRTRYRTLMEFYPRLIDELDELARRPPAPQPFRGGIRAVLDSPGRRVVILPGGEEPGVSEALRLLAAERWKDAVLMDDADALSADLKGRTLIVLGTLAGNRWLRRHQSALQLPVRFDGAKLLFSPRSGDEKGQAFEGDIGLISAAVNPADPSQGLLLYTAVRSELLAGVVGASEGPVDFVVLEGSATVKLGRYEKSRLPWRLK